MSLATSEQTSTPDLRQALGINRGIICFTGAGGKKSTIYRLARECAGRILITATVHIRPYPSRYVNQVFNWREVKQSQGCPLTPVHRVIAVRGDKGKLNRYGGVPAEELEALYKWSSTDICLVKADGARGRLIKAPANYEPVLPDSAECVIHLLSVRSLGKPLNHRIAHRSELITKTCGIRMDEIIRPIHLARLLAHSVEWMADKQAGRYVPVLNMVDSAACHEQALEVAARALDLSDVYDKIVLASICGTGVVDIISRNNTGFTVPLKTPCTTVLA